MIQLRYAHLCDFAGLGHNGKPIVVGIFEILYDQNPSERPISMPIAYLAAKLECSLADGTEHEMSVVLRHEDGEEVHRVDFGRVQFVPSGPGRPLHAALILLVAGITFPDQGDYAFEFVVDTVKIGEAPLYIVPKPPA